MSIVYVINLIVAGLLVCWPYWFSRFQLRLKAINPFLIVTLMTLPVESMKLIAGPLVLIDKGLFDEGFQFGVLMNNLQMSCQWIGAVLFLGLMRTFRETRRLRSHGRPLDTRHMGRAAIITFGLALIAFVLLASSDFGIAAWLANPREGYQLHRTGAGHWFALMITFLSASMLFSFLAKPTIPAILLKTPLYIAAIYFAGSKGIMLSLFTTSLVFLSFLEWKRLPIVIGVGMPLIFSLMVFNLSLAKNDALTLQSIFEYFDYYKNAAMYYRDYLNGQTSYFFGEIALSSYAGYVPRAIWPDKPVVYGITLVNEIYYPGAAELTNTPAFGAAVEYFADFGVVGVILGGLFSLPALSVAFAGHLLFKNPVANLTRPTLPVVAAFTILFLPTFGVYFQGALYNVLLGLLLWGFWLYRARRRSARAARGAGPAPVELTA